MIKKFLLAEKVFVVIALLIFTGAWVPILYEILSGRSAADATDGIPAIQASFYVIYAVTFLLIYLRWKIFFYGVTKGKLLLIIALIALASVFWSDVPAVTLRRSSAAFGTTLFGMYFGTRYTLKEQLHLLAWAFGIAALSSLLFTLAFPAYGIKAVHGGAWRGVFLHKNPFGMIMCTSAIVFLLVAMSSYKYRYLMWASFGLSVSLVVLSTAKTPLVLLLTLLVLLPLYTALRWNFSWMVLFFIVVVIVFGCLAILFFSSWETILTLMGKDATLTGRTGVWEAVVVMIQERPWLGYGYSGFWLGLDGASAYVWYATGWSVPYAHNGILDLWLDLGLLGVLLYFISFLSSCFQAVIWVRSTKTANGLWPLILLTLSLLSNLSESTILKPNNIYWVLYVAVTLSTSVWSIKDNQA